MMIAVSIVEAEGAWTASDVFATFDVDGRPKDGIARILRLVEEQWHAERHTYLPLRWRKGFSISVATPIHFRAIDGPSLQVPLVLALLRAACTVAETREGPASTPFGAGPVFATGELCLKTGRFLPVGCTKQKLLAFVREYGERRVAILTEEQLGHIPSDLISQVTPVRADSIGDLLKLPEFQAGLDFVAGPPELPEVDSLIRAIEARRTNLEFYEIDQVSEWLMPHFVEHPHYYLRFLRYRAQYAAHHGQFVRAVRLSEEIRELVFKRHGTFGVEDRAETAAVIASWYLDAYEPERGIQLLDELAPDLSSCSLKRRAAVLGSRCQLLRALGRYREAIEVGEEAVIAAKSGDAALAHMDLNYLAHALIRRAIAEPEKQTEYLRRAKEALADSRGHWKPANSRSRRSHLQFCEHYEAEIARVEGVRFEVAANPRWSGTWGLEQYTFILFSCARNPAYSQDERVQWIEKAIQGLKPDEELPEDALFDLLWRAYGFYRDALRGEDTRTGSDLVREWCEKWGRDGAPGWKRALEPILDYDLSDDMKRVERLCDAIPYH
jgi:tetratricopeptide (TPR) repeat protein